jgi:hypothetical protein
MSEDLGPWFKVVSDIWATVLLLGNYHSIDFFTSKIRFISSGWKESVFFEDINRSDDIFRITFIINVLRSISKPSDQIIPPEIGIRGEWLVFFNLDRGVCTQFTFIKEFSVRRDWLLWVWFIVSGKLSEVIESIDKILWTFYESCSDIYDHHEVSDRWININTQIVFIWPILDWGCVGQLSLF